MSRKKISTTIYVTPEQSERLRLLHERTKVPVAVYIREGIDLVLRQYGHLLPGQLPLERAASANTPERTPEPSPVESRIHAAPAVEPRPAPGTASVEPRTPQGAASVEPRVAPVESRAAAAQAAALHKG